MKGTSPYLLRDIYKELAGDASAARTTDESELDKRLHEALKNGDPDISRRANEVQHLLEEV